MVTFTFRVVPARVPPSSPARTVGGNDRQTWGRVLPEGLYRYVTLSNLQGNSILFPSSRFGKWGLRRLFRVVSRIK